jgi:cytochrome P450
MLRFTFRPLENFAACARRYGDPFTLQFPGLGAFVILSAPELVKQVFTADPDVLHAGEANIILEPVVGRHSVLLLDGKEHLRQRRLLLPPLHGERMHAYAQLMVEVAEAMLDRMPVGQPFALHPHMQWATLQVILRAVFGLGEGARMQELGRKIVAFLEPPPAIFTFIPVRYLDFPLSPYRVFQRRREAVVAELRDIIRSRREADDPSRTDILSLLLAARDEEGQSMTDDELVDELITMLVAGHETTATALSWAFGCLLADADVQQRLDGELAGALGEAGAIDAGALTRNEYLDAVIKESLRLRPILPDVVRRTQVPFSIAGYEVPAGVNLTPCIYLTHQRAELYPEPERFRPERFVGAKVDPYGWFPFGGGIRRCLGMAFALYEMKVVLGVTLLRARLRLAPGKPIRTVRRNITLAPSGGTRVVLLERRPRTRRAAAA